MVFTFSCPHCGQNISAGPDDRGQEAPCPSCTQNLLVPTFHTGTTPNIPAEQSEQGRIWRRMPALCIAGLCCVVALGLVASLSKVNVAEADEASLSTQMAGRSIPTAAPNEMGISNTSTGQASAPLRDQENSALNPSQPTGEAGPTGPLAGKASLGGRTGIWPTHIHPTGLPPAFEDSPAKPADMDQQGVALMAKLSALAMANQNPATAADASEKLRHLEKAFRAEARGKLPVYREMRDALLAGDESEYHRQANTVNAIALFNHGTPLCSRDELLELATLLQSVMDSATSLEQKEPIEKMQKLLEDVQARKGFPRGIPRGSTVGLPPSPK